MDVSVRAAAESDAGPIAALSAELGYSSDLEAVRTALRGIVGRDDHRVLVAETPGMGVCAWLHAHSCHVLESGLRVEIAGLVVSAKVRRHGVGRALMARAEEWAREVSAPTVVVRSNAKRIESHAFYPSLGYEAYKTQVVYRKKATK
jgi:GNAT superfamily N-acetyltransferase